MATRKECRTALDRHEQKLSKLANVVGLGIVPADESAKGRKMAIGVYVERKLPEDELGPENVIPRTLSIDGNERVPVRVIEQGRPQKEMPQKELLPQETPRKASSKKDSSKGRSLGKEPM